jgi:hypothetical protein
MSVEVIVECLAIKCRHHNKDSLNGACKNPDLVTIGLNGECLWSDILKDEQALCEGMPHGSCKGKTMCNKTNACFLPA